VLFYGEQTLSFSCAFISVMLFLLSLLIISFILTKYFEGIVIGAEVSQLKSEDGDVNSATLMCV